MIITNTTSLRTDSRHPDPNHVLDVLVWYSCAGRFSALRGSTHRYKCLLCGQGLSSIPEIMEHNKDHLLLLNQPRAETGGRIEFDVLSMGFTNIDYSWWLQKHNLVAKALW